ncbi:MAG: chromate resistance protein [Myxococcaceae bacterium]|nr:MAG: chromate resistance protein [Myxococcaceae bacterium]
MKWVTRKRIQVNRAATAWLVRRFIDPRAEFLFVDPDQVEAVQGREGAIGFDAPGARYPHQDDQGRCSFEALMDERCPEDPVLREMARIIHGADLKELGAAPECPGLLTISRGFPLVARDDEETMEKSAFLYDALYASLKQRRGSA